MMKRRGNLRSSVNSQTVGKVLEIATMVACITSKVVTWQQNRA